MNEVTRLGIAAAIVIAGALMVLFVPVNSTYIIVPVFLITAYVLLPRDMLRNPRILLWLFFFTVSLILIGVNLNTNGVMIESLSKNSTITNLVPGQIIYKLNDVPVQKGFEQNSYYGTVKLETNKGTVFENVNGTLGIQTTDVPSSNLKFGLDLKGGVRAIIEPNQSDNQTIVQIISTLQTRINIYGLRESIFRPIYQEGKGYVEISIAGGSTDELRNLLENQGKFESKITFFAKPTGIRLDKNYPFTLSNNSIIVGNKTVPVGSSFELAGIPLKVESVTSDRVNLTATVFSGADIKTVYYDPQRSQMSRQSDGSYRWSFAIQLSQEGAQKFAWVTNNLDIVPGRAMLSSNIDLFLDNNLVDSLTISSSLKGKAETEISISGASPTIDAGSKARAQLQSILRSGALPTSVKIVQIEAISPTLGVSFLKNAVFAGVAALLGVITVVTLRYRKPKIVLPMIIISASEVIIILGAATVINWTIDLPAIAGIIATIGTGIDSQIMIIDQAMRGEEANLTLREKLARAFFIVFGAGGVVIAAMIPLAYIIYQMRGFAITTMIGVIIGIAIVRPAYGAIVQRIIKE